MRTALLILAACLLAACANPTTGEPHPPNALDYPVAVTADPSGRYVWVSSGNFDLSWRGGAVLAVDVTTNSFVGDREATDDGLPGVAQVGGFPGPVHLLQRDGEAVSAYVLSRAEDSLYHLTITNEDGVPRLSCEGASVQENGVIACPSSGAFESGTYPQNGEPVEGDLGADPFGALVHQAGAGEDQDLLLTGGMLDGSLTMFGLGNDGTPRLLDQITINSGLFAFVESPTTGHIIVADTYNHCIRKVFNAYGNSSPDKISTYIGNGTEGGSGDGGAPGSARLRLPVGVIVRSHGRITITDTYNHRIRKVE